MNAIQEQLRFLEIEHTWLYTLIGAIVVSAIAHLYRKYIRLALDDFSEKMYEKKKRKINAEEAIKELALENAKFSMNAILKRCVRKDGFSSNDALSMTLISDAYFKAGGNHDGELIVQKFKELKYIPTVEVPEALLKKEGVTIDEIKKLLKKDEW